MRTIECYAQITKVSSETLKLKKIVYLVQNIRSPL